MNKRALCGTAAAILAVQFALLGWMVFRWERIVTGGVECRFDCTLRDPSDPFRGRYVRLFVNAPIESGEAAFVTNRYGRHYHEAKAAYVLIDPKGGGTNGLSRLLKIADKPGKDGLWIGPRKCSFQYRMTWRDKGEHESYEDFEKRQVASGRQWFTELPDELFMNERLAPAAEKIVWDRKKTVVAIYRVRGGQIVLTGVEVDGVPIADAIRGDQNVGKRKN